MASATLRAAVSSLARTTRAEVIISPAGSAQASTTRRSMSWSGATSTAAHATPCRNWPISSCMPRRSPAARSASNASGVVSVAVVNGAHAVLPQVAEALLGGERGQQRLAQRGRVRALVEAGDQILQVRRPRPLGDRRDRHLAADEAAQVVAVAGVRRGPAQRTPRPPAGPGTR